MFKFILVDKNVQNYAYMPLLFSAPRIVLKNSVLLLCFVAGVLNFVLTFVLIILSGIMIKTWADASNDNQALSTSQIIFNVLGFASSVTTTVIITMFAKRRLKEMQKEEELLL